jgi:hypothetical protein
MLSERIARMLCAECPIKDLCRDYAIVAQEDYGIWGGTNPRERREARLALNLPSADYLGFLRIFLGNFAKKTC